MVFSWTVIWSAAPELKNSDWKGVSVALGVEVSANGNISYLARRWEASLMQPPSGHQCLE